MKREALRNTERILDTVFKENVKKGQLTIIYPSGITRHYGDTSSTVTVKIKRLPLLRLRNPAMFTGEGYMQGDILIDEDQLDRFFQIMSQNPSNSAALGLLQKLPKRQRNRRHKQQKQISHHYDLGNDYYKLWLDKTLTYSCAYFQHGTDSLEDAQTQKINYLLQKLQLKPGHTLLDIGCGWGHLAVAAAQKYGVKVTGITLSQEQLKGATQLAKDKGVTELVTFKLLNYQDMPNEQKYDRIISVGMFEHVGRGNHEAYFKKVKQLLNEDGLSVLHTITDRLDRKVSPWIDKYIFPGGYLPTVANIEGLLAEHGLWSIDREDLWEHYARTLDIWRQRHQTHQAEITSLYDEVFYRMQDFWLAGSAAAFRYGDNGLNQFIFTPGKPVPGSWPLTREYLYTSN